MRIISNFTKTYIYNINFLHSWLRPLTPAARDARIGTIAANRHLRCHVHPRPRALRPARALVCARPRVCARPHYQARARRTRNTRVRATRRHDAHEFAEMLMISSCDNRTS